MAGRQLNTHSQDASESNSTAFARILRVNVLISLWLIIKVKKGEMPIKLTLARCEREQQHSIRSHLASECIDKPLAGY